MFWPYSIPREINALTWLERTRLRDSVMKRYEFDSSTHKRAFFEILILITILAFAVYLSDIFSLKSLVLIAVWIAVVVVLVIIFGTLEHRAFRQLFSTELVERGIRPSSCLICGYSLAGAIASSCPECGTPLAPKEPIDS